MIYERIDNSPQFDSVRNSHELRYHIASGFVDKGDIVVDAGCGTGYGRKILGVEQHKYFGLDKNPIEPNLKFDFENPQDLFLVPFEVFVGFEIIEHLETLENFIEIAKQAKKWIIISTPIIPTKYRNRFHKQDFTPESLINLFVDKNFSLYGWLKQEDIYGIFIFKNENTIS